jgi:predicted dehydrogenase
MKRRQFLLSTTAGLTAAYISRSFAQSSPNDRIQIGCIGVGGMGRGNMNDFLEQPDAEVVAVCDVDTANIDAALAEIEKKGKSKPDTYRDFQELLGREDIDAVMIGTPDHWHCLLTALACQVGKDVYVEKPLSHNVAEGRMAVDAAQKYNRITQLGAQVHQTDNYRHAAELVQSGVLGPISKVRVWLASNDFPNGIGNPADGQPPETADYETWLGPAPERPFNENRFHFKWRYFWDYGGGRLADFTCHIIDPVFWAMGLDYPKNVASVGGRYVLQDNAETYDTQEAIWEFDPPKGQSNPFQLVFSLTDGNSRGIEQRHLGIEFLGADGTLIVDYGKSLHFEKGGELVEEFHKAEDNLKRAANRHKREFLDSIRSRDKTSCDISYGHKVTNMAHLANISARLGKRLDWDGASEKFANDDDANGMLARRHRDPWSPKALGIEV